MTDARFPDRWLCDKRIARLSDSHRWSFIASLVWSVTNRTDGVIEPEDLALIPMFTKDSVRSFVAAGLWEPRGGAGRGWLIVDFAATQTTAEQLRHLEEKRAKEREKKARQRAANKGNESGASASATSINAVVPGDIPGDVPTDYTGKDRQGKDRPREATHYVSENDGAPPFTATAEQLARIDATVRQGYET